MRISGTIKCLFLTALCVVISGCSERRGVVSIKVVATTDVHGRFFADNCLDGSERKGSLAKISTFLKEQREKNDNVIYLDAGDILQGSVEMYHDVTAQFVRPNLPAQAYNLLRCDAVTMGNHDLSAGAQTYARLMQSIKCPVLSANLRYPDSGWFLPPYEIIERHGVRIAVLGLITPVVKYSIPRDMMGDLNVSDPIERARYWVPVLKEEADVVVGLFHSGLDGGRTVSGYSGENIVSGILAEVPGFDVIVYGHDHIPACMKMADCQGDSVLLINPGPYAEKAAVVTLDIDFSNGDTPAVRSAGELVDMTSEKPDPEFSAALSGWHDDVTHYTDSVIGKLAVPLEVNPALWRSASAIDMIHSIQMRFMGAEVSLTAPVSTALTIPEGDFKIRDAFRLYQFDNNMVSVLLKGSEIRDVLEYSAGLFYNTIGKGTDHLLKLKPDDKTGNMIPATDASAYISAAGIDYTIDVSKPQGQRVRILSMSDGTKFDFDKSYRTTINTFLYSGSASVLLKATGLSDKEIQKRFQSSAGADIRYYILTKFEMNTEGKKAVDVKRYDNWKLVPEKAVDGYLSRDTINFSLISKNDQW